MFYQILDQSPFRLFSRMPHVHFHAEPETAEAAEQTEQPAWTPSADVYETAEAYKLVLEIPGAKADAIDLGVEKGVLTVSGETANGVAGEGVKLVRGERRHGKFSRTFLLPREINSTAIAAAFNSGLLEITLPKAADLLPRKVEIAGA